MYSSSNVSTVTVQVQWLLGAWRCPESIPWMYEGPGQLFDFIYARVISLTVCMPGVNYLTLCIPGVNSSTSFRPRSEILHFMHVRSQFPDFMHPQCQLLDCMSGVNWSSNVRGQLLDFMHAILIYVFLLDAHLRFGLLGPKIWCSSLSSSALASPSTIRTLPVLLPFPPPVCTLLVLNTLGAVLKRS